MENIIVPILHSMEACTTCTNSIGLSDDKKHFIMYANSDISIGSSLGLSLGNKQVDEYVLTYGILPQNAKESFHIHMAVNLGIEDPVYALKNAIMAANNLTM